MTLAPALVALAWTLIHSLWQGLVIALVVALLTRNLRRAEFRYALYFGGALASLAAVGITYMLLVSAAASAAASGAGLLDASLGGGSPLGSAALVGVAAAGFDRQLAMLLLLWSIGASLMTARTLVGIAALARLRRQSCELGGRWSAMLDRLRGQLGMRMPVALAESSRVDSPLVLGVLRPLILLPLGLVHRLPLASVEAALLHELVHVRRHDYLMGLALALTEALLFFHPAIWWLSRRARQEREHCCDDGVVAHTGDALRYALALTDLEALRGEYTTPPTPKLGQSATGGELMSRVHRLIDSSKSAKSVAGSTPARRSPNLLMPVLTLGLSVALAVVVAPACFDGEHALAKGDQELDAEVEAARRHQVDESVDAAAMPVAVAIAEDKGDREQLSIAWLPERFSSLAPEIRRAAARHGVDPELVAIVTLLESGGDPSARSSHGARGLMQLMPATAENIAARRGLSNHNVERLDDVAYNLDLGAYHLAELIKDFAQEDGELSPESVELVAAAYNGGATRVRAYMAGDAELSAETARYKGLVGALWSERAEAQSPTLKTLSRP